MEEGKEIKGNLQRISERVREEGRDRLSELPGGVLFHIMKFINIQNAVQTCIHGRIFGNVSLLSPFYEILIDVLQLKS